MVEYERRNLAVMRKRLGKNSSGEEGVYIDKFEKKGEEPGIVRAGDQVI